MDNSWAREHEEMDNSWAKEHEEMERAVNRITRGCGVLALVVAIIVAVMCLMFSIFDKA